MNTSIYNVLEDNGIYVALKDGDVLIDCQDYVQSFDYANFIITVLLEGSCKISICERSVCDAESRNVAYRLRKRLNESVKDIVCSINTNWQLLKSRAHNADVNELLPLFMKQYGALYKLTIKNTFTYAILNFKDILV